MGGQCFRLCFPTFRRTGALVNRLTEFEEALAEVRRLQAQYAWSSALRSIAEQLEYLAGVERGDGDRSKLRRINIGVLAAREVEDMDLKLAERLHKISAEVARMVRDA
jgi:hypothetical protein